jgi:hypothetical protein
MEAAAAMDSEAAAATAGARESEAAATAARWR